MTNIKTSPDAATGTTTAEKVDFNALREEYNEKMKNEWVADFNGKVEYIREITDDFDPDAVESEFPVLFGICWSWRWHDYIYDKYLDLEIVKDAEEYYMKNKGGFVNYSEVPELIVTDDAWDSKIVFKKEKRHMDPDFSMYSAHMIDFVNNDVHRIAYDICGKVANSRINMKNGLMKHSDKIHMNWDFFGEKDVKFLEDCDHRDDVEKFVVAIGDYIVGECVSRANITKEGVEVYIGY